jgi:hypothetical protein
MGPGYAVLLAKLVNVISYSCLCTHRLLHRKVAMKKTYMQLLCGKTVGLRGFRTSWPPPVLAEALRAGATTGLVRLTTTAAPYSLSSRRTALSKL